MGKTLKCTVLLPPVAHGAAEAPLEKRLEVGDVRVAAGLGNGLDRTVRRGEKLRLSERCGAVESLVADGAERVVPAAEAFTLQLLDGKGEPTCLKSSDFAFETVGTRVPRSLRV